MDVNKFMEKSLEAQLEQNKLLAAILAGMTAINDNIEQIGKGFTPRSTETLTLKLDASEMTKAINEVVTELKQEAPATEQTTQAEPVVETKQVEAAKDAEVQPEYKPDDVRAALMQLGKREGTEASIAVLKKYGATSVSGLDAANYGDVIKDCAA